MLVNMSSAWLHSCRPGALGASRIPTDDSGDGSTKPARLFLAEVWTRANQWPMHVHAVRPDPVTGPSCGRPKAQTGPTPATRETSPCQMPGLAVCHQPFVEIALPPQYVARKMHLQKPDSRLISVQTKHTNSYQWKLIESITGEQPVSISSFTACQRALDKTP